MMFAALLLAAAEPDVVAEPKTAIEAEYAFARDAQLLGQWTAFAKWADDEAVLVGSNFTNAKEFAASQADPEQAIQWWPVESWTNCDGTFAFNIGGWENPADGTKGRFHTIWTKTENGWRYVMDMGANKEKYFLPRVEEVVTHRAACDPPSHYSNSSSARFRSEILTAGQRGVKIRGGKSNDATLEYRLMVGPTQKREIFVLVWNGEALDSAYSLRWKSR